MSCEAQRTRTRQRAGRYPSSPMRTEEYKVPCPRPAETEARQELGSFVLWRRRYCYDCADQIDKAGVAQGRLRFTPL